MVTAVVAVTTDESDRRCRGLTWEAATDDGREAPRDSSGVGGGFVAGGRALGEERAARRHMGGPGQGRQRTRGDTCCTRLDSRSASDAEGPCPGKQRSTPL